jgi:hypothetical protein
MRADKQPKKEKKIEQILDLALNKEYLFSFIFNRPSSKEPKRSAEDKIDDGSDDEDPNKGQMEDVRMSNFAYS